MDMARFGWGFVSILAADKIKQVRDPNLKNTQESKMTYHVFEIKANGDILKTVQAKKPDYNQQRKAVGGYIETIPYFTKFSHDGTAYNRGTAYANEEGRLHGLAMNLRAMAAWRASFPHGDPNRMTLCGDVIFYAKVKEVAHG